MTASPVGHEGGPLYAPAATDRMTPATRINADVEVLVGDTWWPGNLEHWRYRGGRWEGWVRWSTGPGENRLGWYDQDHVRPVA